MFLAMVMEDNVLVSQKTHSENNLTPTLMYKCNNRVLYEGIWPILILHVIFLFFFFFPYVKYAYLSEKLLHGLYFPSFLSRLPSR